MKPLWPETEAIFKGLSWFSLSRALEVRLHFRQRFWESKTKPHLFSAHLIFLVCTGVNGDNRSRNRLRREACLVPFDIFHRRDR